MSEDTWKRYRNLMGRFQSARSGAHLALATGAQLVRAFSSPFLVLISMVMSVSSSAVPVVMPSPHADLLPSPPLSPLSPQFRLLLGFLIIVAAATVIIALRCDHIRGCGAKVAPQFDAASARSCCRHHCCNQSSGKSVSAAGTTSSAFASSNGSDSDGMPVLQNLSDSDSDFDYFFFENSFKSNKVPKLARQFRYWLVIRPKKDRIPEVKGILRALTEIENISLAHDLTNEKDIKKLLP